jgi:hypothetical protein
MRSSERFPSRFVRCADLKGVERTLTIERCAMEELGFGRDKQQKPVLTFRETKKSLILNRTNEKAIAAAYGDDDSAWRGQRIILFPARATFGGEEVDAIRVRIPARAAQAAPAAPPQPDDWDDAAAPLDEDMPF